MSVTIDPTVQQSTIALNAQNIGTGGLPGFVTSSLMELKYSFSGFSQGGLDTYKKGDVVVFNAATSQNNYNATIEKANTGSTTHASKMLLVFVSYTGTTLILMHKGYLDFDDISTDESPNALSSWEIGQTLYMDGNSISTTPPIQGGNWVKSIGFCMPNDINKKRIWFESDSTYLTLQVTTQG